MKRIYQIKLHKVSEFDLFQLLGFPNSESIIYEKYCVKKKSHGQFPLGIHPLIPRYDIYSLDLQLLGKLMINYINYSSTDLLLTLYLEENKQRDSLMNFIELMRKDMDFMDFNVKGFRGLCEDNDLPMGKKLKIPTQDIALRKWRNSYKIIQTMQDEAANSDDLDIYIPTLADFRDRLKHDLGITYSERTISDIRKAGKAGLLD
jgi:hypothetical protein